MFDTVLGLPVHVLVIHGVLVLIPAASLAAITISVVEKWRARFGYVVLALTTASLVLVPVATRSGQALKQRVNAGGIVARQIRDHEAAGELLIWPVLAVWVLTVVLLVLHRRPHSRAAARVLAGVMVVAALAAIGQVVIAGHLGSTAVWSCTIGSDVCK